MMETILTLLIVLTTLILIKGHPAAISYDNIIERDIKQMMPDEVEMIEGKGNLEDKSARLLGFLNTLNMLGGLVNSGPLGILGNNNRNTNVNGISATTPRLNGRPGLGFFPDVTKGVNTILTGVAAGNLEQILEGSFIFAPNDVQQVAGNVLNRVFLSTTPPTNTAVGSKESSTTSSSPLTSQEAQLQLLQIIQEQQKQINALEKNKKTEGTLN